MRSRFQFRIRTLLLVTAIVAVVLAGYVRARRLEGIAKMHERQAELVVEHRLYLQSMSFHVPELEWRRINEQERLHRQIAGESRLKIWRPWLHITRPNPPLPIAIDHRENVRRQPQSSRSSPRSP